jgi:hypothetical protein
VGNTIFGIMSRLSEDGGDAEMRAAFSRTMSGAFNNPNGGPYTPLELLVMELFRTISPNGGAISAIKDARITAYGASPHERFGLRFRRNSYISTPHTATSLDPVHWKNPQQCDPDGYRSVPASTQVDDEKCREIGLARCPYDAAGQRRAQGRADQQRLRHRVWCRRRQAAAGLRLCRVRAIRLWLPPMRRRAVDDPGVRRFFAKSMA